MKWKNEMDGFVERSFDRGTVCARRCRRKRYSSKGGIHVTVCRGVVVVEVCRVIIST